VGVTFYTMVSQPRHVEVVSPLYHYTLCAVFDTGAANLGPTHGAQKLLHHGGMRCRSLCLVSPLKRIEG
jgi:hypothetical protein